jgi:hypothetical protein
MDGWTVYQDSWVVVASTVSGLIDPLPDNSWVYVVVEGGDRAHFKVMEPPTGTWKFHVKIDNVDSSTPTLQSPTTGLDGCDVTFSPVTITCRMDDPDTGIDWRTIDFKLYYGSVLPTNIIAKVNKVDTPRMADYFDPKTDITGGTFQYRPTGLLSGATYWVEISAQNHNGMSSTLSNFYFVMP